MRVPAAPSCAWRRGLKYERRRAVPRREGPFGGPRSTRSDKRGGHILMIRLNLVLLLAVLASAMYLVGVQYDSRRLFFELDKAHSEATRLETERERLQVEKRAQATPARVERLAREKLQMRLASPGVTTYVSYSPPAAGVDEPVAARAASAAKKVSR